MNPFGKFLGYSLVRPLTRNTWNVLSRSANGIAVPEKAAYQKFPSLK